MPHHSGEAGRLVHDRVARDDGGSAHPAADRQREVPGCDDSGDAARLVEIGVGLACRPAEPHWRGQPAHLASVVLEEVDRLGHVRAGLLPLLASLQHLPGRQFHQPGAGGRGGLHYVIRAHLR